jgi:hypothetical protein
MGAQRGHRPMVRPATSSTALVAGSCHEVGGFLANRDGRGGRWPA